MLEAGQALLALYGAVADWELSVELALLSWWCSSSSSEAVELTLLTVELTLEAELALETELTLETELVLDAEWELC